MNASVLISFGLINPNNFEKPHTNTKAKDISKLFYDGFGILED